MLAAKGKVPGKLPELDPLFGTQVPLFLLLDQ